jgi:hypothetical protein
MMESLHEVRQYHQFNGYLLEVQSDGYFVYASIEKNVFVVYQMLHSDVNLLANS